MDSWYPGPACQGNCASDYKPPPPQRRTFFGLFSLAADQPAAPAPLAQHFRYGIVALAAGVALLAGVVRRQSGCFGAHLPAGYTQLAAGKEFFDGVKQASWPAIESHSGWHAALVMRDAWRTIRVFRQ
eukprot:scaffold4885_cov154-Isochrysis_galbana.AAC.2